MRKIELENDLGCFEGFNHRTQSAIYPNQTAEQVVNWDHDKLGEAEFWPDGDHPGVALVFANVHDVSAREIEALDSLLADLGDDSLETFVKIAYYRQYHGDGQHVAGITAEAIEDLHVHIFSGDAFTSLRAEAAYELFETYYPEAYAVWDNSQCDGLIFDVDRFLDSPVWHTEEIAVGGKKFLLVASL